MNRPALYVDYKTNEVVVLNERGQAAYRAKYDAAINWAHAHIICTDDNFKARQT